jgi:hypothetical protein
MIPSEEQLAANPPPGPKNRRLVLGLFMVGFAFAAYAILGLSIGAHQDRAFDCLADEKWTRAGNLTQRQAAEWCYNWTRNDLTIYDYAGNPHNVTIAGDLKDIWHRAADPILNESNRPKE